MSGPFDDLIPQKAPGAIAPKGMIYSPPADSLGQQQKAVTLGKSATEAQIAAATQADTIRKARAEADKAQTDAQAAKDKLTAEQGVPAPGNTQLTGEDYLKTIPPQTANQARAMIEGRTPYPTGAALRSPQMQTVIAAAQQADPTYNYANAITRLKTRQDFTSGTTAKNVTAINTALGHLGQLMADAQALKNTGSPLINAPINAVRSGVLGSGKFTALSSDVQAVSDELERAFKGANGTETGVKGWETKFSENSSPDQFLQGGQAVAKLLMGRLENVTDQYNRGMSRASDPMTFLNPHAQAVLSAVTSGNLAAIPSTLPKGFDQAPLTSAWLPGDHGSPPPPPAGGDTPPPPLGSPPKAPPGGLGGIPHADYSGMNGSAATNLATLDQSSQLGAFKQTYRNVNDPIVSAKLNALMHLPGTTMEEIRALTPNDPNPINPEQFRAVHEFALSHPKYQAAVANNSIPTTFWERAASSPGASAVAGFGSGATAGLDDVLGRSLAGPQWDANRQALAALNPKSDLAGNVAGGIAGSLAAPELLAKYAPGASRALGAFADAHPVAAPILGDAAYGGTYGASENPDHPIGGAVGGALAGFAGGQLGRRIVGPALSRTLPGSIGPSVPVLSPAEQAIKKLGIDAGPASDNLTDAGVLGLPYGLADANPQLRMLAGAVTRKSPDARALAEQTFQPRAYGQADRAIGLIDSNLAPVTDLSQLKTGQIDAARTAAAPLYDQAYALPGRTNDKLQALLNTPAGQQGMARARTIAANEQRDPNKTGFDLNDQGETILTKVPSAQTIDYVKRGLDDMLEQYRDPVTQKMNLDEAGRAVQGVKNGILKEADTLWPAYGDARAAYANLASTATDADRGYAAPSGKISPETVASSIAGLPDGNLPFYQKGYAANMADAAENARLANNPYSSIFGSTAQRQKVGIVFPDGASTFARANDLEGDMAKTAYETLGGSPTAGRQQADAALNGGLGSMLADGGASLLASGGHPGLAGLALTRQKLGDILHLGLGNAAQKRASAIAPTLFDTDPTTGLNAFDNLSNFNIATAARRRAYADPTGRIAGSLAPILLMGGGQ